MTDRALRAALTLAATLALGACSSDADADGEDPTSDSSDLSDVDGTDAVSDADTNADADAAPDTDADADAAGDVSEDAEVSADAPLDADAAQDTVELDVPPDSEALDLSVIAATGNPLARNIAIDAPEAGTLSVTTVCGDDEIGAEVAEVAEGDVFLFALGLHPAASCGVSATLVGADSGLTYAGVETFDTIAPDLPIIEVDAYDAAASQPGWTLVNLNNNFDSVPLTVALVDAAGRYRWVYEIPESRSGSDTQVEVVEDGVFIAGMRGQTPSRVVDWQGTALWEDRRYMHHDARLFGDPLQMAYLVDEGDCETGVNAGGFDVADVETGEVTFSWRICDHYLPDPVVGDWSHLNTLELSPDGSEWLLSSRNQNAILAVDAEDGTLLWMIGPGQDIEMADEDHFYQQHGSTYTADNRILLFDNGLTGERETSRLIEIEVDLDAGTATELWSYAPDPDIFAPIWGDADRLPNGNSLGTFGRRSTELETHVIEVTDAGDEAHWLRFPPRWGVYRADRVEVPDTLFLVE